MTHFYRLRIISKRNHRGKSAVTTWVFPPNYDLSRLWNPITLSAFVYTADPDFVKTVSLEKVRITDTGDFQFEEMEMIPPWRKLLKERQHD